MDLEAVRAFLGWCTLLNFGLLLFWWAWISLAGDWVYRVHTTLIRVELSRPAFDAVHYAGMNLLKILVVVFNLVPYLVLRFAV